MSLRPNGYSNEFAGPPLPDGYRDAIARGGMHVGNDVYTFPAPPRERPVWVDESAPTFDYGYGFDYPVKPLILDTISHVVNGGSDPTLDPAASDLPGYRGPDSPEWNTVFGVAPKKESVSGSVNEYLASKQHSVVRALRQSGSPEALATVKLIQREYVKLRLEPTDIYGQGAAGRQPYGTNEVILSLDKMLDPSSAAGFAAHETKHVLQKLTPSQYKQDALNYELEAYRWQRRVDPSFPLRDDLEVENYLKDSPLYPTIK